MLFGRGRKLFGLRPLSIFGLKELFDYPDLKVSASDFFERRAAINSGLSY